RSILIEQQYEIISTPVDEQHADIFSPVKDERLEEIHASGHEEEEQQQQEILASPVKEEQEQIQSPGIEQQYEIIPSPVNEPLEN
ncbi:unnamed protein product, partial [Rotaria magnacalcarata]